MKSYGALAFRSFALSCIFLSAALPVLAAAMDEGVKAYNQKNYKLAAQKFDQALKADAKNVTALYYAAVSHQAMGDSQTARNYYQQILTKFPGTQAAQLAAQVLGVSAGQRAGTTTHGTASGGTTYAGAAQAGGGSDLDGLPDRVQIHFDRGENGHMVVPIYVDGHPMTAWFDTGASEHFGLNQIKEVGMLPPSGPPDSVTHGWAGKEVPIWRTTAEIKLGSMTRRLPITIQQEDATLPPLIGQGFIRGYRYEIDDKGNYLILTKQSLASSSQRIDPLYDVPLVHGAQDDYVPIQINGKQTVVFIDTGSNSTNFSLPTCQKLGIEVPEDAPVSMGQSVGGAVAWRQVHVSLRLGPIYKEDFPILVGGASGDCIGRDFMEGWRTTVNTEKHVLHFFH